MPFIFKQDASARARCGCVAVRGARCGVNGRERQKLRHAIHLQHKAACSSTITCRGVNGRERRKRGYSGHTKTTCHSSSIQGHVHRLATARQHAGARDRCGCFAVRGAVRGGARGAVRGAVRARHHCETRKTHGFRRARGCYIACILRPRSAAREQHDQASLALARRRVGPQPKS